MEWENKTSYLIKFNNSNDNINLVKLREIYLGGNISITDVNINKNEDIIIFISNGSICIFNKCYNYPEYIIDAHLKKISGIIWIEKGNMLISASIDKTIKVYQFPLKWPAEFLRINKQINDLNIVNEIKSETKDLYEQLYSNNNYIYNNNALYNNDQNNKSYKKNYGNIWNYGNNVKEKDNNENAIINHFWKYQCEYNNKNKNKKDNEYDNDDNNEVQESEEDDENNNDIFYNKPEKYNNIDIIFCDDLNGWSKPKDLIY